MLYFRGGGYFEVGYHPLDDVRGGGSYIALAAAFRVGACITLECVYRGNSCITLDKVTRGGGAMSPLFVY